MSQRSAQRFGRGGAGPDHVNKLKAGRCLGYQQCPEPTKIGQGLSLLADRYKGEGACRAAREFQPRTRREAAGSQSSIKQATRWRHTARRFLIRHGFKAEAIHQQAGAHNIAQPPASKDEGLHALCFEGIGGDTRGTLSDHAFGSQVMS